MAVEEVNTILSNEVFRAIDLTGVLLNGVLGGKLARSKRFDAVGFVILAIMSAMGGGIVRDVMLQAGPPVAITDPFYISTAIVGATIAFLWKMNGKFWRITLIVADGVVLGSWAATGAMKTLALGFGIMPALMLGITTAVGGGMIRDVTAGNVPLVFGGNYLYATPALVSAAVMVGFYLGDHAVIGMIAATLVGSSFTVLSYWRKWQLPVMSDWSLTIPTPGLSRILPLKIPGLIKQHKDGSGGYPSVPLDDRPAEDDADGAGSEEEDS